MDTTDDNSWFTYIIVTLSIKAYVKTNIDLLDSYSGLSNIVHIGHTLHMLHKFAIFYPLLRRWMAELTWHTSLPKGTVSTKSTCSEPCKPGEAQVQSSSVSIIFL